MYNTTHGANNPILEFWKWELSLHLYVSRQTFLLLSWGFKSDK